MAMGNDKHVFIELVKNRTNFKVKGHSRNGNSSVTEKTQAMKEIQEESGLSSGE